MESGVLLNSTTNSKSVMQTDGPYWTPRQSVTALFIIRPMVQLNRIGEMNDSLTPEWIANFGDSLPYIRTHVIVDK